MAEFHREVTVDATPSLVFAALTDLDNVREIMPDVTKIRMLSDGPMTTGTKWKETRSMKVLGFIPIRASAVIEVTEFEKNAKYTTVADDGCNWASYTFSLRRAGTGKTKVMLHGQFKMLGKHAGNEKRAQTMADWCEKADGDLLDRVKRHVESTKV